MSQLRSRSRTRVLNAYQSTSQRCGTVTVTEDGAVSDDDDDGGSGGDGGDGGLSDATIGAVVVGGAALAGLGVALGGSGSR